VRYPPETRAVLAGLDLEVMTGRFVAILGRSGSGKSTLLNLLGAMEPPQEGSLQVAGQDLARLDEAGRTLFRRQRLGFVFQSFNLIPVLDIHRNVAFPLALNGQEDGRRVTELLAALGIAHLAQRYPETLSGGEQQRVAVARALINQPSVVFADEPSGNLDTKNARGLHELFFRLREELKLAFVIVTHNEELANMADRKVVMKDGLIQSS
jgi:lipoprotein-releasing system ATP-binding protein